VGDEKKKKRERGEDKEPGTPVRWNSVMDPTRGRERWSAIPCSEGLKKRIGVEGAAARRRCERGKDKTMSWEREDIAFQQKGVL